MTSSTPKAPTSAQDLVQLGPLEQGGPLELDLPLADQLLFNDPTPRRAYSRLFFALQRVARTLMPGIEAALRKEGISDPIWYEILLAADEAGEAGVQMLTLQHRLFVPQYTLSRHIARMQKAGLIRRKPVAGTGRGQTVHLTESAQGLHQRVWKVYRHEIEAAFADRLSPAEAYSALKLVNRLYR